MPLITMGCIRTHFEYLTNFVASAMCSSLICDIWIKNGKYNFLGQRDGAAGKKLAMQA